MRYVLEGSVRRLGEYDHVNAQLISTETGAHVWADRFDGERSKLGQLQVEFVSRLANSLGVELVKAESLRAMRERPTIPTRSIFPCVVGVALTPRGSRKDAVRCGYPVYFERARDSIPSSQVPANWPAWDGLAKRDVFFPEGTMKPSPCAGGGTAERAAQCGT